MAVGSPRWPRGLSYARRTARRPDASRACGLDSRFRVSGGWRGTEGKASFWPLPRPAPVDAEPGTGCQGRTPAMHQDSGHTPSIRQPPGPSARCYSQGALFQQLLLYASPPGGSTPGRHGTSCS